MIFIRSVKWWFLPDFHHTRNGGDAVLEKVDAHAEHYCFDRSGGEARGGFARSFLLAVPVNQRPSTSSRSYLPRNDT